MSELAQLIKLFREQMESAEVRHQKQMEVQFQQVQSVLIHLQNHQAKLSSSQASYNFPAFDSTFETWRDYWSRFNTFLKAHAVAKERSALVFLTNQSKEIYQIIKTESSQWEPPRDINSLDIDDLIYLRLLAIQR